MAFRVGDKVVLYKTFHLTDVAEETCGVILKAYKQAGKQKYEVYFPSYGYDQIIYHGYLKKDK